MEMKTCPKCKTTYERTFEFFYKNSRQSRGFSPWCKQCDSKHSKAYFKTEEGLAGARIGNKKYRQTKAGMIANRRHAAKKEGIPFLITANDIEIPQLCPVLGIPLTFGNGSLHDGSPTLDKIVPHLGYVPGNVVVISHKANRMKNNATLDDLKSLVAFLETHK